MRRAAMVISTVGLVAVRADAQTMFDTLRQLRSTVRSLGTRQTTPAASGATVPGRDRTGAAPNASVAGADTDAMVPDRLLADDPSDTALAARPLVRRRVGTFDVRGFKLGMSPREAARAAAREGFRRRDGGLLLTMGSFDVEATRIANHMLNRPIERTSKVQLEIATAKDAAGNTVVCEFTPTAEGPRLRRVGYTARLDGTTPDAAQAALVAKYGAPIRSGELRGTSKWAEVAAILDTSSPTLISVIGDQSMTLELVQSPDWIAAQRNALDTRARQIAAAAGAGVKF